MAEITKALAIGRRGVLRAKITRLRQQKLKIAAEIAAAQAEMAAIVIPTEASKKAEKKKAPKK